MRVRLPVACARYCRAPGAVPSCRCICHVVIWPRDRYRFDSIEDGELADIWYALGGAAVRHPDHFQPLMDAVFAELLDRRGEQGLNPWLEQRFRAFRFEDSREDATANGRAVDR
jgi:hypothetical protein